MNPINPKKSFFNSGHEFIDPKGVRRLVGVDYCDGDDRTVRMIALAHFDSNGTFCITKLIRTEFPK